MNHVLIDTDVLLDFLFDREPYAEDASKILIRCEHEELKGFITPVMLSNLYYLLRKISSHELVVSKLSQLLQILNVLQMDKDVVDAALGSKFKDFEDALQNYSAEHDVRVSTIITRNTKDYKHSKLSILTPEQYLKANN